MLESPPVSILVRAAIVTATLVAAGTLRPADVRADTPSEGDNLALQEIVVSASRVGDQSVQKIPMAISVVSPAALDAKGLSGISDFVGELPSVNLQSVSPGENVVDMRGLVTNEVNPTNTQQRSLVRRDSTRTCTCTISSASRSSAVRKGLCTARDPWPAPFD